MTTKAIVEKFGGQTKLAELIGKRQSTIAHWVKTGVIPAKWPPMLLKIARENTIDLKPSDFLPEEDGAPMLLEATHTGNFKEEFGIEVECYVLNDKAKTAVISQRGMGAALKLGEGGRSLPRFVEGKVISEAMGGELMEKISKPLIFKGLALGGNMPPPRPVYGYDVTILIDICKAILQAETEGKLLKAQENIAKQAHVIINASAKAGIKGLVYALSGYDATRQEIIESFKLYVREEARQYESEFPNSLYDEWYRIYQLPRPERNKPWKFMHLTMSQVYFPLANSKGRLQELLVSQRKGSEQSRRKKLFQFLTDIGTKALRTHLGQLLGIYESNVNKVFGTQRWLDFGDEDE